MTARYADIVLPAATYLETEDLYRAYGTYYLQYAPRRGGAAGRGLVEFPAGAGIGASAWGSTDPVFRMAPRRDRGRDAARRARRRPPRSISTRCAQAGRSASRRTGGQEFRTPSGKLEFYSEQLAAQGLPPMPDWQPDPEEERQRGALAAAPVDRARLFPGAHRLFRRRVPAPARGAALLHPAPRRGRRRAASPTAQRVRLFNDRGAVGLVLRVSDEVLPGVVLVPGQRPDGETVSGTVNMLCSDRYTDLGDGATYQSTFLDIAAWPDG